MACIILTGDSYGVVAGLGPGSNSAAAQPYSSVGAEGVVDVRKLVKFSGAFEPLNDPVFFNRTSVDAELGTVTWPNGADLDPQVLYWEVSERMAAGRAAVN